MDIHCFYAMLMRYNYIVILTVASFFFLSNYFRQMHYMAIDATLRLYHFFPVNVYLIIIIIIIEFV